MSYWERHAKNYELSIWSPVTNQGRDSDASILMLKEEALVYINQFYCSRSLLIFEWTKGVIIYLKNIYCIYYFVE